MINVSPIFFLQSPSQHEEWYMKGALDVVLRHCTALLDGSPLTEKERVVFEGVAVDFGRRGLRGEWVGGCGLGGVCDCINDIGLRGLNRRYFCMVTIQGIAYVVL